MKTALGLGDGSMNVITILVELLKFLSMRPLDKVAIIDLKNLGYMSSGTFLQINNEDQVNLQTVQEMEINVKLSTLN